MLKDITERLLGAEMRVCDDAAAEIRRLREATDFLIDVLRTVRSVDSIQWQGREHLGPAGQVALKALAALGEDDDE